MAINQLQLPGGFNVPQVDFSSLAELPGIYKKAQQERTLADLGAKLSSGQPVDYNQAAAAFFKAGDAKTGFALLQQAQGQEAAKSFGGLVGGMYGGGGPTPAPSPQPASSSPYANAISSIESGGNYAALGPVTKTGDRAFGKYQVMGANIGPWSKEVLGRELTPQEFLSSKEAQDAIFNAKFGGYVNKYGPEGAARAWFAGEGGMNDLNRRDQLGTSVGAYGQKFAQAYGPAAAAQPPAPTAQPPAATAPAPVPGTDNPAGRNVALLLRALSNPNLPAAQREQGKVLLEHALKQSDLPEVQRNYGLYVRQALNAGTTPDDFTTWDRKNKQAGATAITVDQRGENAFESEFGKKQADRWNSYIVNGQTAQKSLVDINNMREISRRLGVQGAQAGLKEAIGPYAEALKIDVAGLPEIQAYSAIIQRLAPQQRAPGSGSTSDIEFKGFLKSLPGLSQNPQAREVSLDTMEALARNQIAEAEIASRLATKEISRAQAERELRLLPDPMSGFREWRKANPDVYGQALKSEPLLSSQPRSAAPRPTTRFTPAEVQESLSNARAAIQAKPGARDAIIQRLRDSGIDPSGL